MCTPTYRDRIYQLLLPFLSCSPSIFPSCLFVIVAFLLPVCSISFVLALFVSILVAFPQFCLHVLYCPIRLSLQFIFLAWLHPFLALLVTPFLSFKIALFSFLSHSLPDLFNFSHFWQDCFYAFTLFLSPLHSNIS